MCAAWERNKGKGHIHTFIFKVSFFKSLIIAQPFGTHMFVVAPVEVNVMPLFFFFLSMLNFIKHQEKAIKWLRFLITQGSTAATQGYFPDGKSVTYFLIILCRYLYIV